jgi:hypothetical protein
MIAFSTNNSSDWNRPKHGGVVLHPEYVQLYEMVEKLCSELADLLTERDILCFHTCKNIEAEYMRQIGVYEYKIFELECQVLRIKRKTELIQAKFNRQEMVSITKIEQILDNEYAEYNKKLKEKVEKIDNAMKRYGAEQFSEDDANELKQRYRQIVKILHPDLNPNRDDQQKQLFLKTVAAFENADLETIRAIELLVENKTNKIDKESNPNEMMILQTKSQQLQKQKEKLLENIAAIKNSFPYNQQDFLNDKEQTKERIKELNIKINEYKEMYRFCEQYLKEILEKNQRWEI